jgi:replicative DNA helicase
MSDQIYLKKSNTALDENIKVPPHSIEAEQSVLGGLLLDNKAWDQVIERLAEKDFYRENHRLLFQAISHLFKNGQPVDVLTVTEVLKTTNDLDNAGGEVYLFELARNTPSVANIVAYADIVRERSVLRQLITAANEIANSAYRPNGRPIAELLDHAERKVFQIALQRLTGGEAVLIRDLMSKAANRADELYHSGQHITGLATGFTDFDEMTAGLQPADLIIIAGRPSMGKTSFAMNIAENVAIKAKKGVLVFSMEMPGESLATRMLSGLGRIDQHRLRTGRLEDDDFPRIASAVAMLSDVPMYIDDAPALSPNEIRSRARRILREQGQLGLIVVDYLQLMQVPSNRENRTAEISEISRSLKSLARELNVPVIALSQLNRSLEQRADRRPVMSDLRESGSIEQDADLIAFIYRDEVYNEGTADKGVAEIIIAKHRNGPIGKVKLTFKNKFTKFENHLDNRYGYEGYV